MHLFSTFLLIFNTICKNSYSHFQQLFELKFQGSVSFRFTFVL